MENLEKQLMEINGQLIINKYDEFATAIVFDSSNYPMICSFEKFNCVEISSLDNMSLSIDVLEKMIKLIKEANEYNKSIK